MEIMIAANKQGFRRSLRFESLEDRQLLAVTAEFPHLHESCFGPETVCSFAAPMSTQSGSESLPGTLGDQVFQLHSNPSAKHTIYLDFTGFTTVNTSWNQQYSSQIVTPAFSLDNDYEHFSELELAAIHWIWACVSEDFAPFYVNVTTELPESGDLMKSGSPDDRWGIRVVIGGNSDWYAPSAGGVAYMDSFNDPTDTPCFVFSQEFLKNISLDSLTLAPLTNIASAISHEVGHTLGLSHDGHLSGTEYYEGHTVSDTVPSIRWGSIMGDGYNKSIVQWSRGEYAGANNREDDLAIITLKNGFGYRADDHGSSMMDATVPTVTGTSFEIGGIIERNTDYDYFVFQTTGGTADLRVEPTRYNGNLDAKLELLDGMGNVIAVSTETPENALAAAISIPLAQGVYFLRVSGCGKGDSQTGYSEYGSLGQYTLRASGIYSEDFPAPKLETFELPPEYPTEKWILQRNGDYLVITDDQENVVYQQELDSLDGLVIDGEGAGATTFCFDMSGGTFDLSHGLTFQGSPHGVNVLEILGTDGDDDFFLQSMQGTFNGMTVSWDNVSRIHVDTFTGNDCLEIQSVDNDSFLHFRDGKLSFHATTIETVEAIHVENMIVSTTGDNGSVRIVDTPLNDAFFITNESVTMKNDRFSLKGIGFETAELTAMSGGKDAAWIQADEGAMIVLSDFNAEYRNLNQFYRVWYVETVTAINSSENNALLIHHGSSGTDFFQFSDIMTVVGNTIGSYHHKIIGFPAVYYDDVQGNHIEEFEKELVPALIPESDLFDTALLRFLVEESGFLKKRRLLQSDEVSFNFDYQTLLDLKMK